MSDEVNNEGGDGQMPTEEKRASQVPQPTEEKRPSQSNENSRPSEAKRPSESNKSKPPTEDGGDNESKDTPDEPKTTDKDNEKDQDKKDDDEDQLTWCCYLWRISRSILLFCLGSKIACELTGCVLIPPLERMH